MSAQPTGPDEKCPLCRVEAASCGGPCRRCGEFIDLVRAEIRGVLAVLAGDSQSTRPHRERFELELERDLAIIDEVPPDYWPAPWAHRLGRARVARTLLVQHEEGA